MRVFELASELGTTSRELLQLAQEHDLELRTQMSSLDDDDIAVLKANAGKRVSIDIAHETSALRARMEAKVERAHVLQNEKREAEAEALKAAVERSHRMEAEAKGVTAEPEPEPEAPVEAPEAPSPAPETEAPVAEKAPEPPAAPEPEAKPEAKVEAKVEAKPEPKAEPEPKPEPKPKPEKELPAKVKRNEHRAKHDSERAGREAPPPAHKTKPKAPPEKAPPEKAPEPPPILEMPMVSVDGKTIHLRGTIIVKDLAKTLGLRPNVVIAELMRLNILASINQRVEMETARKIAEKHGYTVVSEKNKRSAERHPAVKSIDSDDAIPDDDADDMQSRAPVVTFLGHVDHGKTSLLDKIRDTGVAAGESGGITQHIGAYMVEAGGRPITFLDTPGHAAFTAMRARGASLTDLAVIIIAADDGVMPQTKEAIRHAREANVSILVAINKCDLPAANPDRVRTQLQGEGLTPEEWGGDTICAEVSAETGEGVDHLLEMILLQAEVLELDANPKRRANGYVIEAQLEPGRGPTASLLVTGGTLKVGDAVLCGQHWGRVRALINDSGKKLKEAGPSMPVKCMGLSGVPEAGAEFIVMPNEKRARSLASDMAIVMKGEQLGGSKASSLDALMSQISHESKTELAVILKADTQGSVEAIEDSLNEIKSEKIRLSIVYSGTGNVIDSDIQRAAAGVAVIVGFHVNVEHGVTAKARHHGVQVRQFRIIYELIDYVRQEMINLLAPEYREIKHGKSEIRAIFNVGKRDVVAGCLCTSGSILSSSQVRVMRGGEELFDGRISSLRHFQDEVKEVREAQECGVRISGFDAIKEGDTLEFYGMEEMERAL